MHKVTRDTSIVISEKTLELSSAKELYLTEDVIYLIFVHLSRQEVFSGRQVCRSWNEILIRESFWNAKGYETITDNKLIRIAYEIWGRAINKSFVCLKDNKPLMISALKFVCASRSQTEGLMLFGFARALNEFSLKNTYDLPPNLDEYKLILLKGPADLYKPSSLSSYYKNHVTCKILFGNGLDASKCANLVYDLDQKLTISNLISDGLLAYKDPNSNPK